MKEYLNLWRRAFDFKGRSTRRDFWLPFLVNCAVWVLAVAVTLMFLSFAPAFTGILAAILWAYLVVSAVPFAALTVRRLHDTGRSGWWYLLVLLGGVGFVILAIMCFSSTDLFYQFNFNQQVVYGPPPIEEFNPGDNLNECVYGPPEYFDISEETVEQFDTTEETVAQFEPADNIMPDVYGPPEWFE